MSDRPEDRPDRERPKPPVVPPVARPVTPPVAKPVVPPVQPPVVRPATPPTVAPVLPPVARPATPPTVAPVQPPVLPPAPPVVRPATPPPVVSPAAAPSVVKPAAAAPAPSRSSRAGRAEAEEPRGGRSREVARGRAPVSGGMGLGPKVGLLTGLVAALALAVAVLPGMKDASDDGGQEAFRTAGLNTAAAFAAGLSGSVAPTATGTPAAGSKAIELLAADLDAQVKELNIGGETRTRLNAVASALKATAAGRSAAGDLKGLVDDVTASLVQAQKDKDEDRAKPLRQQRERLLKILEEVERGPSAAPATAPEKAGRLTKPLSAGGYEVLAAWLRNGGRVTSRTDGAPDMPDAPAGADRVAGSFEARLGSKAVTVFHAPAGAPGTAFVAFATPAFASGGGGGGKIGLLMLVLGPLLVGGLGWMLASAHGKPVRDLARELDRLGTTGDPGRRIAAHGPEANSIARSVERMVANLKFRSQHEMSDLQEVISKEQGMAAQIHQGLMPKNPPRIPAWEVETLFKPGFEIGGDHFDYFRIDDRHLGVIIMDTSVRGAAAAIVMSMARAYVHAVAPGVLSPAEVLRQVNRLLASDLSQGQYVTALYVVIDTESGTAKVASGGHLPLVVFRSRLGKTAIVNPEGIALGLDSGPVFDRSLTEVDVDIGAGDRLVLHTDGALKVQSETGEEFGEQRLYETIQQKAPMNSQAFVNFVGGAIDAFHLNTPQNDDITISTVKRLK